MGNQMQMERRAFLRTALGGAVAASRGRAAGRERPPNILVIMSDEHNQRIAGCYGNRLAGTRNLDRLAERGITFENHYTNSPLCVPSRLAFTAGKYIHRIAAWNNDCRLPSDEYPSLPRALNAAGYESFLCGKQHYDAEHRYGFIEIGGRMNDNFMNGRGNRRAADDTRVNVNAGKTRFADFRTGEDSSVMSHDRAVTAGVVDFLSKRKRGEKPFFLFAGYLAPHFPLIVPERYWQLYRGKVAMPEIPAGFFESMPLNYKHLRWGFGLVDVDAETVRRGRELYYGFTQWVDEQIGVVLEVLNKSPFLDETVVIYTTDHGENMGEHGLWWKNCLYEQAAHIPLIVSWPKRWSGGQRRTGACSMVDVVRTIAEIGGAQTPGDWDGRSMVKWMDDAKTPWRDLAVSQYYAHNIASGYAMLRTGDWKYVYHSPPDARHPAEQELYDLKADPQEFRNLARQAAHKAQAEKMHARLLKELGEHPDETEQRCRGDYARGYGREAPAARKPKGKAA
jgi:choline-sulfatase